MTFISVLYTLIIAPLELLFEVIFSIANRLIGNAGLSIIFLSLAVNFLVLPLYKRADELQAEERDIQTNMASRLKHIKSTFKGDERFFMIQEYYRINHYKPVYALKSSLSVLLQIPFFIAAYNLLSGMQGLQGMRFGFIPDLGKEDALFMIGNFPVNVLPILMTLINIVSGIIYTKGHPVKEKVQVYGLAAVFLILLYRSPSGLVFYWLLNNVFSLVKNVFYKLKDPKKALNIVLAIAGLAVIISSLIRTDLDARQKVLLSIGGILLALPLATGFIKKKEDQKPVQKNTGAFVAGTILMALVTGLFIPSAVIDASTLEFVDFVQVSNPVLYILNAMLLSFGSWVLWGGVFYFFAGDKTKALFSKAVWIICGISIADYMLFGTKLGNLSSTLQYDISPSFKLSEHLVNLGVITVIIVVFSFLYAKIGNLVKYVLCIGILAVFYIGFMNSSSVMGSYTGFWLYSKYPTDLLSVPLSTSGKNVIVMFIDRAMGTQVPYILNEKPELKEKFDGFTYYPNTISYGPTTLIGSPALYGGYEYTPSNINARNTETLRDKQNEALKVLPVLFYNNGYSITISDPAFANYKIITDASIYDDYPDFHCCTSINILNYYNWDKSSDNTGNVVMRVNEIRNRNFFIFALMKVSPLVLQETIYDGGLYNEAVSASGSGGSSAAFSIVQTEYGVSKSKGYNMWFLNAYAALNNLSNLTVINDSKKDTFIMMYNDITHSPSLLQEPDYTPSADIDNTEYDTDMVSRYTLNGKTMKMENYLQSSHYHANMAVFLTLGEWFDYLREKGVYDNTRIILVSDHGHNLGQFDVKCNDRDMEFFMPLLMFKDFNAKGFTVNEDFMTNGDTPVLATAGIIRDPVNPFTGKPLNSNAKNGPQTVFHPNEWDPAGGGLTTFPEGDWYTLSGKDPHIAENWKYAGRK
ncbi:MAG: membrane protein insertase YidC [Saccharofermentans sp.]|nr:membrane protein insertase YidC [Saccharofermentans sp.]